MYAVVYTIWTLENISIRLDENQMIALAKLIVMALEFDSFEQLDCEKRSRVNLKVKFNKQP